MPSTPVNLVDILREFITAHRLLNQLADRYRRRELTFPELQEFVGDDEGSVLFRLKEKCHALFRPETGISHIAQPREAIFDLTVGSLFHEAMKFREDFYQREVYGPRVKKLRAEAAAEADKLFLEFGRILSAVSERLEDGLAETQSLMAQSWAQLRVLLAEQPDDGFITRFLLENQECFDQFSPGGFERLLEHIHGHVSTGYVVAGRSYLKSGHYEAAQGAFKDALEDSGHHPSEISQLSAYAQGMSAYLNGNYSESLARLSEWVEGGSPGDPILRKLVDTVLRSLERLVDGEGRDAMLDAAAKLLEKLGTAN
jgi:tetratricopeptide (TPR) repeat protein